MSMISAQIDELRAMARLEKSLERPAIARILVDAADTIWQLRDNLQRANAENAKLRKLVRHMRTCIEHYEPDGSVGCEHCPLNNDTGNCDYERRMRELGVTE